MQNLYDNMAQYGYDLTKLPFVVQYNKRDLPNAAPIKDLQVALNPGWPGEVLDPAEHPHGRADPPRAGDRVAAVHPGLSTQARGLRRLPRRRHLGHLRRPA